jgi:hypothetical protein
MPYDYSTHPIAVVPDEIYPGKVEKAG